LKLLAESKLFPTGLEMFWQKCLDRKVVIPCDEKEVVGEVDSLWFLAVLNLKPVAVVTEASCTTLKGNMK